MFFIILSIKWCFSFLLYFCFSYVIICDSYVIHIYSYVFPDIILISSWFHHIFIMIVYDFYNISTYFYMWSLCGACSAHVASCCLDAIKRSVSLWPDFFWYHSCNIVVSFPGQFCILSCLNLLDAVRKRFDKGSGKMMEIYWDYIGNILGIWWEDVNRCDTNWYKLYQIVAMSLHCHYNIITMSQ